MKCVDWIPQVPRVPQCSNDRFGLNFCDRWCSSGINRAGDWGCHANLFSRNDSRNTDNTDYICSCEGCNGCPSFGGDWRLVRHAPEGPTFHPSQDSLKGTQVYGDPDVDSAAWSILFTHSNSQDEFLFADARKIHWVHMTRSELIGTFYNYAPKEILRSSASALSYRAIMINREGHVTEPKVAVNDWGWTSPPSNSDVIMYAEGSFADAAAGNGGRNVFFRSASVIASSRRTSTSCVAGQYEGINNECIACPAGKFHPWIIRDCIYPTPFQTLSIYRVCKHSKM